MRHNGLEVVVHTLCTVTTPNYVLGEWSRDPYVDQEAIARIQAWCTNTFGTHEREQAIHVAGRLYVGPRTYQQLQQLAQQP